MESMSTGSDKSYSEKKNKSDYDTWPILSAVQNAGHGGVMMARLWTEACLGPWLGDCKSSTRRGELARHVHADDSCMFSKPAQHRAYTE
eukprot:scaffold183307_cov33-Prasinocladus_malaysianus.AAC.1